MTAPNKSNAIREAFAVWGLEARNQTIINHVRMQTGLRVSTQLVTNTRRCLLIAESTLESLDTAYLLLVSRLLNAKGRDTLDFAANLIERMKHDGHTCELRPGELGPGNVSELRSDDCRDTT